MYILKYETKFDSAHRLTLHKGQCKNLHGHTWRAIISLGCEKLNEDFMVMDFKDVKTLIEPLLPDHKYLNEDILDANDFGKIFEPTCENLAKYLFEKISYHLDIKTKSVFLISIELFETDGRSVLYYQNGGENVKS